jgi:hypothetical protein
MMFSVAMATENIMSRRRTDVASEAPYRRFADVGSLSVQLTSGEISVYPRFADTGSLSVQLTSGESSIWSLQ